ncbi:MAG: copper-binding protein [Vitreimonas sp.]
MLKTLIVPIVLIAAACSPPASQDASKAGDGMNMEASAPAAAGPIAGTGAVTQIDAAAGTITIDHEPIAAINWPQMTMQFTAEDPSILQGISVGDRVSFELKSASESTVLATVRRQ